MLAVDDTGYFYITSERVGFHGQRKQFTIALNKIISVELRPEGLFLFKDGRELPFILTLNDYEVPLRMTSLLLGRKTSV